MTIKIGMKERTEVLQTALIIEKMTTTFLAGLLGIKDLKESKVLGNKSGCLSFNQKIDLLIDLGALSKENRGKFQTFMEVRNQFMHNLSANNYENCFSFTNGSDKFILKTYPQEKTLSREEMLKKATIELSEDIAKLTANIINKLEEKLKKDAEFEVAKKSQEAFIMSISQLKDSIDEFINEEIKKNPTFNTVRLEGFGTEISEIIFSLWRKNFKTITNKSSALGSEK